MPRKLGCMTIQVDIAAGGTAQQVIDHLTEVSFFTLSCPASNTSTMFIGGKNIGSESAVGSRVHMWQLTPGDSVSIEMPKMASGEALKLDLQNLYANSATTDDILCVGHFNA